MSKIISFGKSDVGLKRSNNEDAFILKPELDIVSVADGMGGPASGEVASGFFIESVLEVFSGQRPMSEKHTGELVQKIYQQSNDRIFSTSESKPEHHGMGCTAEVLAFYKGSYVIGHVGDSRTYLFRNNQLRQITQDHSIVQDQLNQGLITAAEARNHSLRHVILRAVGVKDELAVDIIKGKCLADDLFLLCSDGLTDMVEDDTIRDVLSLPLELNQKADRLIDSAKEAGGNDNITVVLCQVI